MDGRGDRRRIAIGRTPVGRVSAAWDSEERWWAGEGEERKGKEDAIRVENGYLNASLSLASISDSDWQGERAASAR